MGFWHAFQSASGMGVGVHWTIAAAVAIALLLGAIAPDARNRLRAAVTMILIATAGLVACGVLLSGGATMDQPLYRWTRFASLLILSIAIINIAGVLLFRVLLSIVRLQPPPILRDIILAASYIAVALMLLARHNVDLTGIVATSAVVTAVIGFSLQDTLGNIMGGMALQLERSIAVGDWIRVGDVEGYVREIRWRQTSIETRNWDTVVIPNSVLMKSQVTVLGRRMGAPPLHRMWVYFTVDYRYAPPDVIEAVERALQAEPIPNVATEPKPNCVLKEFKESFGQYAVRYWLIDLAADDPTSSEVRSRIYVALRRAGMDLSIPAQSLFVTVEDTQRKEAKQREQVEKRVAALRGVSILNPLTDDERRELAARMTVAPFRKGEVITRQGNEAHHLYIITRGRVEVRLMGEAGETRKVATLMTGDFFGEMGLMTGEPRHATVVANTDAVCYRVDKAAFTDTLTRRPEIAEEISHLLAKRKVELDAIREGLNEEAMHHRMSSTQSDLLVRIKRFFTLR